MLIVIDNRGQMCNRMWAIAPFIALAKEYNKKIYILNFQEYKSYYRLTDDLVKFELLGNSIINELLKKVIRKIIKNGSVNTGKRLLDFLGIKHISKDTDLKQVHKFISENRTLIVEPWESMKDNTLLYKHKEFIKELFTPVKQYQDRIDNIFNTLRKKNQVIVGVHIRRGDYKSWKDGKYFYNDQVYAGMQKQIQAQFPGQPPVFYICSNEDITGDNYSGIDYYTSPKSHPVEDLYALSKCDYIIGPPSTFSMWASFYGNVPIYFIHDADSKIDLKDFSPIVHQNYKEDGSRLWI